jgi:predicted glycoside hydrolase/deacetylase ChbG (UPF0249 family)
MAENSNIYLSIVSDDFGMLKAVNDGTAQAFTQGLLTDTNLMAPCPGFAEAAQWAKDHKIRVGIHVTFTASWDYFRYKPLTPLRSMVQPDGTFRMTVDKAWERPDMKEAEAEFEAQWRAIEAFGLNITYICEHMGSDKQTGRMAELFDRKAREKRTPYLPYSIDVKKFKLPHYAFNSIFWTSGQSMDLSETKGKLKDWLHSLKPGHHLWACHAAVDDPAMDKMCEPNNPSFHWARTYRKIDQALLLDPEVRSWIEKRGIQRVPISSCPVAGF